MIPSSQLLAGITELAVFRAPSLPTSLPTSLIYIEVVVVVDMYGRWHVY